MISRKWMTMGASILLAAMLFTVPASAHGHHSRGHHNQTESGYASNRNAAVQNNTNVDRGAGSGYSADTNRGQGAGCAVSTDGETVVSCPVHVYGAAEGNCPVCAVDGCDQTGHHLHDDTVYCGYPHAHGYCDGSCAAADEPQAERTQPSGELRAYARTSRGHHGCH